MCYLNIYIYIYIYIKGICNKDILFSISYMSMHDMSDCAQKKNIKKKKSKEKEKAKRIKIIIASVFSRRHESYMM